MLFKKDFHVHRLCYRDKSSIKCKNRNSRALIYHEVGIIYCCYKVFFPEVTQIVILSNFPQKPETYKNKHLKNFGSVFLTLHPLYSSLFMWRIKMETKKFSMI